MNSNQVTCTINNQLMAVVNIIQYNIEIKKTDLNH